MRGLERLSEFCSGERLGIRGILYLCLILLVGCQRGPNYNRHLGRPNLKLQKALSFEEGWDVFVDEGFSKNGFPLAIFHRKTGMEFRFIPKGSFSQKMYNWDKAIEKMQKKPDLVFLRKIRLTTPFYISRTLISNGAWRRVMGKGILLGYFPEEGKDSQPISDFDQEKLGEFLKRTGLSLPTEAQWDWALRAGASTDSWWGDLLPDEAKRKIKEAKISPPGYAFNFPVGLKLLKKDHPFGLLDTPATMLQICKDNWRTFKEILESNPTRKEEVDPIFLNGSKKYVVRGNLGIFNKNRNQCYRQSLKAKIFGVYGVGIRLVKNLKD